MGDDSRTWKDTIKQFGQFVRGAQMKAAADVAQPGNPQDAKDIMPPPAPLANGMENGMDPAQIPFETMLQAIRSALPIEALKTIKKGMDSQSDPLFQLHKTIDDMKAAEKAAETSEQDGGIVRTTHTAMRILGEKRQEMADALRSMRVLIHEQLAGDLPEFNALIARIEPKATDAEPAAVRLGKQEERLFRLARGYAENAVYILNEKIKSPPVTPRGDEPDLRGLH